MPEIHAASRRERQFALLVSVACVMAALGGVRPHPAPWLAVGAVTAGVGWWRPAWLAPALRGWLRLGEAMGRIVNPLVLGVLFFGVISPIAILMRLFGRDELRLRPAARASFWRERAPESVPAEQSFRQQF